MRNDSIETLLLRHYGSGAPAPVDLEHQLSALVRAEAAAELARQQAVSKWSERRISRRRVLGLATFSGVGVSILALGANALRAAPRRTAYSL